MKSALWKDNLREIKDTFPRFLSILAIIMLGVSFFIGIKATGPSMVETAQEYYEEYNLPDGRIYSTAGLNQADLDALSQAEGFHFLPMQTLQTTIEPSAENAQLFTYSGDDATSFFKVIEGRMPENDQEIVLDEKYLTFLNEQLDHPIEVGDTVQVSQVEGIDSDRMSNSEDSDAIQPPHFVNTEFEVVGFAQTPLYFERSNRGIGSTNVFGVVHDTAIKGDLHTEVYYWAEETQNLEAYTEEYQATMDTVVAELETAIEDRPAIRLAEMEDDLLTAIAEGEEAIAEGYEALEEGQTALEEGRESLESGRETYDEGQESLAEGRDALIEGQEEYEQGLAELASGEQALIDAEQTLAEGETTYQSGLQAYNEGVTTFAAQMQAGEAELINGQSLIDQGYVELGAGLPRLETGQQLLDQGYQQLAVAEQTMQTQLQEQLNVVMNPSTIISELDQRLFQMTQELIGIQEQIENGYGYPDLEAQRNELTEQMTSLEVLRNQLETLEQQINADEVSLEEAQRQLAEDIGPLIEAITGEPIEPNLSYNQFIEQVTHTIEAQLSESNQQLEELENQATHLPGAITTLQQNIADVELELSVLEDEQATLQESINRLNKQTPTNVSDLKVALQSAQVYLAQLQSELAIQQNQRSILQEEYDVLVTTHTEDEPTDSAGLAELQQAIATTDNLISQLQDQLNTTQTRITDLEKQLVEATTQEELDNQRAELQTQLDNVASAMRELTAERTTIQSELTSLEELANQDDATLQDQIETVQYQIQVLEAQQQQFQAGVAQISSAREALDAQQAQLNAGWTEYTTGQEVLETAQLQLEEGRSLLEAGRTEGQNQLDMAYQALISGRSTLDQGYAELAQGQADFQAGSETLSIAEKEIASGWAELNEGERAALAGLRDLNEAEQLLTENEQEFNEQAEEALSELRQGEQDLDAAQDALTNLSEPTYAVNDRTGFASYQGVKDNADQLNVISNIFPVFFLLIAVLVTFTTIKRMASEQRTYMGTMKQLGYPDRAILLKFVTYAALSSVIGIVLGWLVGYLLFPPVILGAYNSMYYFDTVIVSTSWYWNIIIGLIALATAVAPAILQPYSMLKTEPANLLRPAPPRSGSKILLERIAWLWNRLSFKRKMTVRNLFRYKGRNLMTLFGVAGCTMLIVTGFGISDTISGLVDVQMGEIQTFDSMIYVNDEASTDDVQTLNEDLKQNNNIQLTIPMHHATFESNIGNGQEQAITVVVPMGPVDVFQEFVFLRDRDNPDTHLDLNEQGPMINERLAEHYNASVGDTISIVDSDLQEYTIEVNQIYENYINHYIFMTAEQYQSIFNEQPIVNNYYVKYVDGADTKAVEDQLSEHDTVLSVLNLDIIAQQASNAMGSLDIITVVLIIAAASLAFVVLYNLTNINIGERIRELSTIKVLGFYDLEVSLYIYDEIFIISVIGALLGLGLGTIVNHWIMKTMQMGNLLFFPNITLSSYLISFVISILFTIIVMIFMHYKLKNIDMVEALKVVE